jgi:hypothetical protein
VRSRVAPVLAIYRCSITVLCGLLNPLLEPSRTCSELVHCFLGVQCEWERAFEGDNWDIFSRDMMFVIVRLIPIVFIGNDYEVQTTVSCKWCNKIMLSGSILSKFVLTKGFHTAMVSWCKCGGRNDELYASLLPALPHANVV